MRWIVELPDGTFLGQPGEEGDKFVTDPRRAYPFESEEKARRVIARTEGAQGWQVRRFDPAG